MPKTKPFLFVNKNASSSILTQSDSSSEKAGILRHVQQRRRQQGAQRQPQAWEQFASSIATQEEKKEDKKFTEICRLPQIYPHNNDSDPFHCTVIGNGVVASIHPLLWYAFATFSKPNFLLEAFAPAVVAHSRDHKMRHSEIMTARLQRCVHDEMLMHATLAYGSSAMAWTLGRIEPGRPPEYFIDKTLRAVRARLLHCSDNMPQEIDVWLLLSVYLLAITEMWNGMPQLWAKIPVRQNGAASETTARYCRQASRIHLRALAQLVESIGGWDATDSYVLESAILGDKFLAMADMSMPVLPLTWEPYPAVLLISEPEYQQIQRNSSHSRMGESFHRLNLCPNLASILRDTADYCRTALWIWSDPQKVTLQDERWMYLRLQSLIYRVLLLEADSLNAVEDCVRLATLLFLLNSTHDHGVRVSTMLVAPHLRSALVGANLVEGNGNGNGNEKTDDTLLLWLLSTGGLMPGHSHDRDWFFQQVASVSITLAVDLTHESFRELLEGYFFIAEKQEQRLTGLQENIEQMTSRAYQM